MKFYGLLTFVHIAIVSTQLVRNQESSRFINNQYKNNEINNAPAPRPYRNNVANTSETRQRDESFNYNIRSNKVNENKRQRNATDVKVLRADQKPKVFTNINQDQNNNSVRHIQRLNSSSQPDKIIFKDEVKYDQEPFTNKRKPDDNSAYSTVPSKDLSATPYTDKPTSKDAQRERSSKGSPKARDNVPSNKTVEGHSKIDKNLSTTEKIDLENRVAFTGDNCPTGQVKVDGKCVKEM